MTSWGDSSSPRPTQDRSKRSFTATIKAQFRQLAKLLTIPPAEKRRQTRGGFRQAAYDVIRWMKALKPPVITQPVQRQDERSAERRQHDEHAYEEAREPELWEWNNMDADVEDDAHYGQHNYASPEP